MLWTAWHVEAFARSERLPSFASLRREIRGEDQPPEEQLQLARAIAAALGGD